jgi:hypothetical protein
MQQKAMASPSLHKTYILTEILWSPSPLDINRTAWWLTVHLESNEDFWVCNICDDH